MPISNKERKERYQGFALSTVLVNEIKKVINGNDEYKSVASYVRKALREKMDKDIELMERRKIYAKERQLSKEVFDMLESGASKEDIDKKLFELSEEQTKVFIKIKEISYASMEEKLKPVKRD